MARCIVITGAGSGLGRSLARRLARDGDTIVVLGRTPARFDTVVGEFGGNSWSLVCVVASANSVRTAFAAIAKRHPTVDVLINNAGVYQPSFVKDATDAQIGTAVMTNFAGPVYCSRAAIPLMKEGGHII